MFKEDTLELIDFINRSPTPFHAVENISSALEKKGFIRLNERDNWQISAGKSYYLTRNMSSVIAFRMPQKALRSIMIVASHSDSPCFKLKNSPEMEAPGDYIRLNTERYGGMLYSSWLDRNLSVAGRLILRNRNGISAKLVNIDRDTLMIPSLAIHMDRAANDGASYQPQTDLIPITGSTASRGKLMKAAAEAASVDESEIIDSEMFVYNRQPGSIWGADEEYFSAPRIDDLQCAFSSMKAIMGSRNDEALTVMAVLDNEEVGSSTKQGAKSTFLSDVLERVNSCLGRDRQQLLRCYASSMMLSADNAHAVHPNHSEKADPVNRPKLNGGVVIKHSANQKYTTDGISSAILKTILEKAEIPYQVYTNNSNIPGGSTLGNLSAEQISIPAVDVGAAQLAMHSAYETAGVSDTTYLIKAMTEFYSTSLCQSSDGQWTVQR